MRTRNIFINYVYGVRLEANLILAACTATDISVPKLSLGSNLKFSATFRAKPA